MKEGDVSHVRATSGAGFELTTRGPAGETRGEPRFLTATEVAAAIRALPQSHEIRFSNDSSVPVSIAALVNAALQRRPGRVVREAPRPGGRRPAQGAAAATPP